MTDASLNRLEPDGPAAPTAAGDVPEAVRRRYLTERRGDDHLAFYVDARVERPAFQDHGWRLATDRNDPQVIGDLIAIARHRGWTRIAVRGHSDFRREAWRLAGLAGLEVVGYRPTARDRQDLERQAMRRERPRARQGPSQAQAVAEAVVRARIVEPAERDRVLRAVRQRVAAWVARAPQRDRDMSSLSREDHPR